MPERAGLRVLAARHPGRRHVGRRDLHARGPRRARTSAFLAENTEKFLAAARKRPEFARLFTTLLPSVPQLFADVDRDKVLKQGITLSSVYQTLQAFLGGAFVNYFNRFGRVWQVYVQAEGEFRTRADNVGQFYVRNADGQAGAAVLAGDHEARSTGRSSPSASTSTGRRRSTASSRPGYSTQQGMKALEEVFAQTMPREHGLRLHRACRSRRRWPSEGVPPAAVFGFSLLVVFLHPGRAVRELDAALRRPPRHAHRRASARSARSGSAASSCDVFSQIGLVMVIGLAAKNAILIVEFCQGRARARRARSSTPRSPARACACARS